MIADRCFDQKILYSFLEANADQFSSNIKEQIAKSGNGDLGKYTLKLCERATIVYESDGNTIKGMLIGYTHDLPADGASYIPYIIVSPDFRKQGVMRRLLEEYEAHCRTVGVFNMWLATGKTNTVAQKAYEHYGFVCAGVQDERTLKYVKSIKCSDEKGED